MSLTPETPGNGLPYRDLSFAQALQDLNTINMLQALLILAINTICALCPGFACELWNHYSNGTGEDFNIDPRVILRDEFADAVEYERRILAEKAARACSGPVGTVCTVEVDSLWRTVNFEKSGDLQFGVGHMRYRLRGTCTVTVGERGSDVSAVYSLDVYKDWNFDGGKAVGGVSLDLFAAMQFYGVGQEFRMFGTATGFQYSTWVSR